MKSYLKFEGYNVHIDSNGYPRIWVNLDGKGKLYLIHRLIARRIWGEAFTTQDVHHKDGNKLNWAEDNLELLSHADHMLRHAEEGLKAKGIDPSTHAWCYKCKQAFPKESFCSDVSRGNKLSRVCRACNLRNTQKVRIRGGESFKDVMRQRYAELMQNEDARERRKAQLRRNYLANREKILERQRLQKLAKKALSVS